MDRISPLPPPAAPARIVGGRYATLAPSRLVDARGHRSVLAPVATQPLARRIALAHDCLLVMRGAERTFAAIADLYADAPIFTLLRDQEATGGRFAGRSVTTSPLPRLGARPAAVRRPLPLDA